MKPSIVIALIGATALSNPANAQEIQRHAGAANAPILASVTVSASAELLYLSGQVPAVADTVAPQDSRAAYGDTRTQATSVFRKIDALLKAQGYGLGDVIKLTVYLVGDPALGGKQDFAGFSAAYAEFFGTAQQPNKVARSTVQVVALANPGYLVEIEATAARLRH